ncbi:MAG: hypothetical protein ACT4NJ_04945 [Nitrosopumilaceae archaeon]
MKTIILITLMMLPFISFSQVFGNSFSLAVPDSLNAIQYQMMGNMMQKMCSMMSEIPEDVVVKVTSPQVVGIDKNAHVTIAVLDKKTAEPAVNSKVIVVIEKGAPMTSMDMIGPMFLGKELGDGEYQIDFILDEKGYYTVHTHVIPDGKSMHSMMKNHLDIGLIAK